MLKFIAKIKTAIRIIMLLNNWPIYFADYFGLIKKPYIICFKNGIKYKIRPKTTDRGLLNEIWANYLYTPKGFEIKKNDLILDIGAHIGIFSVFASKFADDGKIYSFEPTPENFKILKENLEFNKIKNIVLINKAVSSKNEKREIILCDANTGGHSFFKIGNDYSKKIKIQTISLDKFVKENKIYQIDFLKMDCEGAEYEILFSCSKEVLRMIKKISMEYHNLNDYYNGFNLKNFLEKNGFKVIMKLEADTRLYATR